MARDVGSARNKRETAATMSTQRGILSILALACAAFALGTAGCSGPPTVDRTLSMRTGDQIWVRSWARCDGLKPELQVQVPPANGTLEFRPIDVPVDHATWECLDDNVKGVGEYYVPKPGFTGQDEFTVTNWWGANFRFPSMDTARIVVVAADATPWPTSQAKMHGKPSSSTTAAELPPDIQITPPEPEVPPALAMLSGTWSGSMCPEWAASVKVAVEQVTPAGANMVYAVANSTAGLKPTSSRIDAVVKQGDELRGKYGQAEIALRGRSDGLADIFWSQGSSWCSGVLARMQETSTARPGADPGT
jgi:hypothetical protein